LEVNPDIGLLDVAIGMLDAAMGVLDWVACRGPSKYGDAWLLVHRARERGSGTGMQA